jgi:hypothetical protein
MSGYVDDKFSLVFYDGYSLWMGVGEVTFILLQMTSKKYKVQIIDNL